MRRIWLCGLAALLALWTQGALGQLEIVTDQGAGPAWLSPGSTAVTQIVTVKDQDDNSDNVIITKVLVENVVGTAVASDFALIEILDGEENPLGSKAYPFSFPVEIDIGGVIVSDSDGEATLQVRVTVAHAVVGHRTIRTRLTIIHTEGEGEYARTVDDRTATTINNLPVAEGDSYEVDEDEDLSISAPGLLENDSDPDGDSLSAELVSGPSNGTVNLNSDGSFTYTPGKNFSGTDSFTYKARDPSGAESEATVTITVNPVNDPPVARDDSYSVNEDTTLSVSVSSGVLGNDSDPDGDSLSAELVSGPSNGTVNLNSDGSFTYTPNPNFSGTDSFTYKARDPYGAESEATVTIEVIPVNDPPVAREETYSVDEDATLSVDAPGVLENDEDPDGDSLMAVLVYGPFGSSFSLNSDGSFTYTPYPNFYGTVVFYYVAYDGQDYSDWAPVYITVNPVNDPPVAQNDDYSTDEEVALNVPAPGVLFNDIDPDGDSLTVELVSPPSQGNLTLNQNGSFTYTPNPDFFGTDTFTYRVHDGAMYSGVATVTITVVNVNDPPVTQDDSYSVNEDTTLSVSVPGVLGNDSDPDGDSLEAELVSGPSHGSLTLNADGSFTYTPKPDFFGTVSFKYKARDPSGAESEATVTITVNPVNDAPVAGNDTANTREEVPVTIEVLINDSDVDGTLKPATVTITQSPANGTVQVNADGTVTYTPKPDFFGTDTFKYKVKDNEDAWSNEAMVTVTVTMVPYNAQRTLSIGWNMISVPLKPHAPNNTPAAVFGDDIGPLFIYRWDPNTGQYITPPELATVDPGHGYWVYIMTEGIAIDIENAQRIDGDYEVSLGKAGWHMISTPTVNVYWGYCKFSDGTTTKTYTEAVAAGWIAPLAFRWDPAANAYVHLLATGVIEPWVGYWIRTYVDNLVLILPVYDAIHNPPLPPQAALAPTAEQLGITPPPPPVLPLMDKATGFSVFNYPNPIRDVHTTKFVVLGAGVEAIRVTVYDLSGRLVWRGETLGHELTWHTDDLTGKFLANGVYLYIVEIKVAGQWVRSEVKRLVILR